jgi:hypothetical protein
MDRSIPHLSRRSLLALMGLLGGVAAAGTGRARAGVLASTPQASAMNGTPEALSSTAAHPLFDRAQDPRPGEQLEIIASFADLERETQALGLTRPDRTATQREKTSWLTKMTGLAFPRDFAYSATTEWYQFTGFDVADVHQTIEVGEFPDRAVLWAGAFDREIAISTWSDGGYERIQDDGEIAIYSISADASSDLDNPIQRVFLAGRNNVAIVGDELVIFTPTLDLLRTAIERATGIGTALGDAPDVAALLGATPELASSAIVSGAALQSMPDWMIEEAPDDIAAAIATQMAQSQMPPIQLGLIGITPGGPMPAGDFSGEATPIPTPETARLELSLLMDSAEAARHAIDVVGERLKTAVSLRINRPFSIMFASWDLSVAPNAPVARISIELTDVMPKIWRDMLDSRDLSFLA